MLNYKGINEELSRIGSYFINGLYNLSLLFYKSIKFKNINQKEQKRELRLFCILRLDLVFLENPLSYLQQFRTVL